MHRLLPFALPPVPCMRMPHQQSQASRLNDLLFEVVTIVAPHIAYSFVPKSRSALHTFARAGRRAGTRGETKSQLTQCSDLYEHASIAVERFSNPVLLSLPRTSGSLALLPVRPPSVPPPDDPACHAAKPRASGVLGPSQRCPRHRWSRDENRPVCARSAGGQWPQWHAACPGLPRSDQRLR
jgi:hypothetical protein